MGERLELRGRVQRAHRVVEAEPQSGCGACTDAGQARSGEAGDHRGDQEIAATACEYPTTSGCPWCVPMECQMAVLHGKFATWLSRAVCSGPLHRRIITHARPPQEERPFEPHWSS